MKYYLLLTLVFITTICKAEQNIHVYYEEVDNGYNIYADNKEFCPMSVKITFNVKNLKFTSGNNVVYVLEPLKKRQLITKLVSVDSGKGYQFSYSYSSNYGDDSKDTYDSNYVYDLPFTKSNSFTVYQGYNGNFSHQGINALDFTMPEGTEITAVRDGVVIDVVKKNTKSCETRNCNEYNNFIIIYHSDGTFAEYSHIKQNGSKVKPGDKVKQGEVIGYSGNVGWSTGPHLHLVVYLQKLKEREALETKFKTGNGDNIEYLIEQKEYSRNY